MAVGRVAAAADRSRLPKKPPLVGPQHACTSPSGLFVIVCAHRARAAARARGAPAPATYPATVPAAMKVREVIAMLRADGWQLDRQVGSHRQFRHPTKAGTVTVAGNLGKDLKPGTLASIRRQAGLRGDRTT